MKRENSNNTGNRVETRGKYDKLGEVMEKRGVIVTRHEIYKVRKLGCKRS